MSDSAPPAPGTVLRYAYLWADEHAAGREEGRKDRPAVVLVAAVRIAKTDIRVLALAVTHAAPRHPDDAVAFPSAEKRRSVLTTRPPGS